MHNQFGATIRAAVAPNLYLCAMGEHAPNFIRAPTPSTTSKNTMEARLLRRPLLDLLQGPCQRAPLANTPARRHESSYRRTKQRLNIKPDASFLPSNNAPSQDHIIFNPPSSAPTFAQTPLMFLPKDDKRRQLLASAPHTPKSPERLPPPVKKQPAPQRHHLTEEDVKEIQRLRREQPDVWTRLRLAKKYNCSSLYIGIVAEQTPERRAAEEAKFEAVKARWGNKRKSAREDRVKRRGLWLRDE